MKLISPSIEYEQSYLEAINEFEPQERVVTPSRPLDGEPFEEFVKYKISQSNGLNLPAGYVPSAELWLIDNGEFIGQANIRHKLNDWLLEIGGHIGYWIRPSKRKKGYGREILKLALVEARKIGLKDVLVTCDVDNIGSRKVIEASGGKLENIVPNGQNPLKMRYWLT